jgi:hypothetical protein
MTKRKWPPSLGATRFPHVYPPLVATLPLSGLLWRNVAGMCSGVNYRFAAPRQTHPPSRPRPQCAMMSWMMDKSENPIISH